MDAMTLLVAATLVQHGRCKDRSDTPRMLGVRHFIASRALLRPGVFDAAVQTVGLALQSEGPRI